MADLHRARPENYVLRYKPERQAYTEPREAEGARRLLFLETRRSKTKIKAHELKKGYGGKQKAYGVVTTRNL